MGGEKAVALFRCTCEGLQRITPAWAGKSAACTWQEPHLGLWDHPRVGGEKADFHHCYADQYVYRDHPRVGGEKRCTAGPPVGATAWDHPRVGGEKRRWLAIVSAKA